PDDAKYTLTSKWRLGQSIVTDKFLPKKKYRMELVLQVKPGYTFTNDAHITIGTKEATIVSKVVENPNMSQNCVKLLVEFPMTDAPDNLEQQGFKFRVIPESKTYGDANFIVYTQGGNGDGKIVITSSDPKVLEIVESDPISGMAIIRVKGGGIAKLKATKESGTDGTGVIYNSVTVESNEIKVNPKILIVKAVDKTIKVGTTTTVFPVEITGFVNGDNAQNIQGFVSPTATCTIPVLPKEEEKKTTSKKNTASVSSQTEEEKLEKLLGDYEIIVSGGTPTLAYAFKYVNGSLSLTKSGVQSYPAASQTFLKENSYVIEDRRNGIEITDIVADSYFDAGTELLIKNMTYRLRDDQKALYNANVNAASKDREIALIYDIKLKSNGDFIQPTGDVKVTIDLPHSLKGRYCDLQVAYIDDYGNVTLMPQALGENSISFLTDHFSYYAVVGKLRSAVENSSPNTEVPQTGDNFWCSMVYWFKEKLNIN
ncbi:MAG: MBG domain-containing protein, partial [Oscillospiraceae bacterium]